MSKKFLSVALHMHEHPLSEKPVESGWYMVRTKEGKLAWCFFFDTKTAQRWDWEEDLSNPADVSKLVYWYSPNTSTSFQNVIVEL